MSRRERETESLVSLFIIIVSERRLGLKRRDATSHELLII